MGLIAARNWLDHHSGRMAQNCAVRLTLAACAVRPSDRNLDTLVDEQIIADLLELAFHGRRVMEWRKIKDLTIGHDPLWPTSGAQPPKDNLFDALGRIIHATKLEVKAEAADLAPNPYGGRQPRFSGSVQVTSDTGVDTYPIGALAAAFLGHVLGRVDEEQK